MMTYNSKDITRCVEFFTEALDDGLFHVRFIERTWLKGSYDIQIYHNRGGKGACEVMKILVSNIDGTSSPMLSYGNRRQPKCMDFVNEYIDILFDLQYAHQLMVIKAIFETDSVKSAIILNELK